MAQSGPPNPATALVPVAGRMLAANAPPVDTGRAGGWLGRLRRWRGGQAESPQVRRDGIARDAPRRRAVGSAAMRAGLLPWAPVLLSAGIGLWFALPAQPGVGFWAVMAAIGLIGALAMLRAVPLAAAGRIGWSTADALRLAGMAAMLIALGAGLAAMRAQMVAAPVMAWRYYGPVEGRVVEIDRSARDRMRLTLDGVVLRDTAPSRSPARVRLSLMGEAADGSLPSPGQRVMLTGHLGPPPGPASPGSFDFRQFAWFEGLGAVGYARTPIMTVAPPQGGIWAMHRARMNIASAMRDRIGGQKGAVAAALMTGDRSGIAEATNDVMRASNLYHIISISGLHMSMLAGFVYAALRMAVVAAQAAGARPFAPAHKLAAVGALAASAGYLWLSGGGVATERAFIMVAVMLAAILADRRAISLRTVAVAALVILVIRPESLISPGFQLSFAATVALILTLGPWSRLSPALPRLLRPPAMLILSSLVAGMVTAPIAAAHFSRMAEYGLLANLLAVPVMGTLVMPAGVIAALLAPLGLDGPALWVMGAGTAWMLGIAERVAGLDGAVRAIAMPPWQALPLLCFGAALMVLSFRAGQLRRLGLPLVGTLAGAAMAAASAVIWARAERPLLLIAPEAEAAGLMTDAGRAISKPKGGAFVVENWLLEDGDTATQEQAAARPAWQGDGRDHVAQLPDGWQVLHFTGKGAGERALPECRARRVVIVAEAIKPRPRDPSCLLIDVTSLRRSGALTLDMVDGAPRLTSVAQAVGDRPWAGRD